MHITPSRFSNYERIFVDLIVSFDFRFWIFGLAIFGVFLVATTMTVAILRGRQFQSEYDQLKNLTFMPIPNNFCRCLLFYIDHGSSLTFCLWKRYGQFVVGVIPSKGRNLTFSRCRLLIWFTPVSRFSILI